MTHSKLRMKAGWIAAVVLLSALLPASVALAGERTDAEFYDRQWNLQAIDATAVAWAADRRVAGDEVLVAVVDTGIDYLHPDLVGRVDLENSISLIGERKAAGSTCQGEPGTPYGARRDFDLIEENAEAARVGSGHLFMDFHSHGTGVSGLIASNAEKLAGVTQRSKLLAVKVHGMGRRNCLSTYLEGIEYAARQGADVIHMSIPLEFDRQTAVGAAAVTRINQTLAEARAMGAVLVAAAGNNGATVAALPRDAATAGTQFRFCQPEIVFCVSATAPGPGDPVEDPFWDKSWPLTNRGSAIDVAGPGGSAEAPVTLTCSTETQFTGAPQQPCREESYVWTSTGTSFGAAATSGLAALLFRVAGRDTDPAVIEGLIERSADDLGDPDWDPFYGEGRINAREAVLATRALPAARP